MKKNLHLENLVCPFCDNGHKDYEIIEEIESSIWGFRDLKLKERISNIIQNVYYHLTNKYHFHVGY